jgi:hypothetical protein
MPLAHPRRDDPPIRRHFGEIGPFGKRLARGCGVTHSQICMVCGRAVGLDNAHKMAGGVARILGLPDRERLELAAEITGHPGNVVRGRLGNPTRAARLPGAAY